VVLNNGEKFNPVTMEGIIMGSPLLAGALIVGQGKFQAALLLEPKATAKRDTLIDNVWPYIEKANIDGPAHAKIFRSKVLITDPDKPFARVGKGTVARGAVCIDYAGEIDAMYSEDHRDAPELPGLPKLVIPDPLPTIKQFLRTYMTTFLSKAHFSDNDDFFSLGLDSVQTLEFTKGLKVGFRPIDQSSSDMSWLSASQVYRYPTVESLSDFLNKVLKSGSAESTGNSDEQRAERMEAMVKKYTKNIMSSEKGTNRVSNGVPNGTTKLNVALTGSTGTLGTHLLEALLKDPSIGKVVCLNRSSEAQSRHEKDFQARGINQLLDRSQVVFLTVGLGQAQFGLSAGSFARLTSEVDVVIHNAWKVDFNHQLESFESQIRAVADFATWSLTSGRHPHIVFVSSLASVGNWSAHNHGPVPETPATDPRVAQQFGYGESKHVAERVLQHAQEHCGVPATILRVGQIAGPSTAKGGVWNKAEWLPSLVQTSKALRLIPEALPDPVDWIPVDQLSQIILEVMHEGVESQRGQIYHLVNPNVVEWSSLVPVVQKYWEPATTTAISLPKWIQCLREVDTNDKNELAAKPATKIMDFYADLGRSSTRQIYETNHGLTASSTMAGLKAVSEELMKTWLEHWGF
jgi:thioester reductase-like protein